MVELISTGQAAEMAGVATSSVKRWADLELIPTVRTAGGHRRVKRAEFEAFLRARGHVSEVDAEFWADRLLESDAHGIQAALFLARSRLGAWHLAMDAIGRGLAEIGRRWAAGELDVFDEHLASNRLERALHAVAESLPCDPAAPVCLLSCAERDEHTLGLSLAQLCVRAAGWQPLWLGRAVPIAELVSRIEEGGIHLVALSASAVSSNPVDLRRQAEILDAACYRAGTRLVLGGEGAWPESLRSGLRLRSFQRFHEVLIQQRGKTNPGGARCSTD